MTYLKNKFVYKVQMRFFDRTDLFEVTDVNKQANQTNVIFVTTGSFQIKALSFNQMFGIDVTIY